jgi:hypothetical protein
MKYSITLSVSETYDDIEFDHVPTKNEIMDTLFTIFVDDVIKYSDIKIECEPIESE